MKKLLIELNLLGLILGVAIGWLLFAQPDTKAKIVKDQTGIHIYSYYSGSNGAEIKQGWEYWLHSDMVNENKYKYKKGTLVISENGTDYASWEHTVPGQRY